MSDVNDTELFDRLIKESRTFEIPYTAHSAFDPVEIEGYLVKALQKLTKDDTVSRDNAVRLWVASKSDDSFEETLFASDPGEYRNLKAWCQAIFKNRSWGLVVNGGERWLVELSEYLASRITPITQLVSIPGVRFELVIFMGNYARTPFGLHTDPANLRSIHFHVAGESKHFVVGENSRSSIPNRFDRVQDSSKNQKKFETKPGDAFVLPAHCPHYAGSSGFSCSIALTIRREFEYIIHERAINEARSELTSFMPFKGLPTDLWTAETPHSAPEHITALDMTVAEWINQAVRDYTRSQLSKCGFTKSPIQNSRVTESPHEAFLLHNFPVFAIRQMGKLRIIARGTDFDVTSKDRLWVWFKDFLRDGHSYLESDAKRYDIPINSLIAFVKELETRHAAQLF